MLAGPKGANEIEIMFSTITMFTTMCNFAYIMNSIGIIVDDMNL
jgi:hypothetical protein